MPRRARSPAVLALLLGLAPLGGCALSDLPRALVGTPDDDPLAGEVEVVAAAPAPPAGPGTVPLAAAVRTLERRGHTIIVVELDVDARRPVPAPSGPWRDALAATARAAGCEVEARPECLRLVPAVRPGPARRVRVEPDDPPPPRT
jgi:hypothetical protein